MARFGGAEAEVQEAVDQTLSEALTYYYDNNHAEAVEAFASLPDAFMTARFRYLYADAALKSEEFASAVEQYQQLLAMDSRLHPARLGLAVAYFKRGEPEASRRELQQINEEALPEYLRNRLAQLRAAVEETDPAVHKFHFYLSQNIQWDSNIGVVPDEDAITAPSGAVYRFTGDAAKESGWRSETMARAYWYYKRFADQGFQWKTKAMLYNLEYVDSGRSDSFSWKIQSGPDWRKDRLSMAAPFTFGQRFYNDARLYDLYGVSPQVTYRVNRSFRVKGRFGYFEKDYFDNEDDALDQFTRTYEIGPIVYYNKSWDYLSLSLGWEEDRAGSSRFSDDTLRVSLSASSHFREDIRGYFRYTHRFQDYKAPFPGWHSEREDDEDSVYVSVIKEFSNGMFIDVNLYWAHNDSNTDLFDYDRVICGAGVGFRF